MAAWRLQVAWRTLLGFMGANSYPFLFNGCPRGGLAQRWRNRGSMSRAKCQQLCDSEKDCNVIEVNGCLANAASCGKNCYTFYGSGTDVRNGRCVVSGDQKSYRKQPGSVFVRAHLVCSRPSPFPRPSFPHAPSLQPTKVSTALHCQTLGVTEFTV